MDEPIVAEQDEIANKDECEYAGTAEALLTAYSKGVRDFRCRKFNHGIDLHNQCLDGIDLSLAELKGANLNRTLLRTAILNHTDLSDATLVRADLCEADMFCAKLSHANCTGADLRGADMRWAVVEATNFFRARFGLARLQGCMLSTANITEAYLIDAAVSRALSIDRLAISTDDCDILATPGQVQYGAYIYSVNYWEKHFVNLLNYHQVSKCVESALRYAINFAKGTMKG